MTNDALETGGKLVAFCQAGQYEQAIAELYAENCKHIEAYQMGPDMPRVTEGLTALKASAKSWSQNHEVHGAETKGPYPHGEDRFSVWMSIDVTPKVGPMAGKRMEMEEVCLYTVKNGKITQVEFFWDPTGY